MKIFHKVNFCLLNICSHRFLSKTYEIQESSVYLQDYSGRSPQGMSELWPQTELLTYQVGSFLFLLSYKSLSCLCVPWRRPGRGCKRSRSAAPDKAQFWLQGKVNRKVKEWWLSGILCSLQQRVPEVSHQQFQTLATPPASITHIALRQKGKGSCPSKWLPAALWVFLILLKTIDTPYNFSP